MAKKQAPSRQSKHGSPNVISDYDPIAEFEREIEGRPRPDGSNVFSDYDPIAEFEREREGRPRTPLRAASPLPPSKKKAKPGPKPDLLSNRPRPVETGISDAIKSLWPRGIPRHVRADDRDAQIKQYLADKKYDVPNSDGALRRAVQRALKG